jgi:hypothetical protein
MTLTQWIKMFRKMDTTHYFEEEGLEERRKNKKNEEEWLEALNVRFI